MLLNKETKPIRKGNFSLSLPDKDLCFGGGGSGKVLKQVEKLRYSLSRKEDWHVDNKKKKNFTSNIYFQLFV